jgi:hypothetical protein
VSAFTRCKQARNSPRWSGSLVASAKLCKVGEKNNEAVFATSLTRNRTTNTRTADTKHEYTDICTDRGGQPSFKLCAGAFGCPGVRNCASIKRFTAFSICFYTLFI